MFPGGWPGLGLLILRVAAAASLFLDRADGLREVSHPVLYAAQFAMIAVGILLLAGLWTPVVAILQTIIEVWFVFAQSGEPSIHYLLAALGISLAMLGPGAWSIDARLFGRKRIEIGKP